MYVYYKLFCFHYFKFFFAFHLSFSGIRKLSFRLRVLREKKGSEIWKLMILENFFSYAMPLVLNSCLFMVSVFLHNTQWVTPCVLVFLLPCLGRNKSESLKNCDSVQRLNEEELKKPFQQLVCVWGGCKQSR